MKPMRQFHLGMQIDRRRQVLVQKIDGLRPDVLGQRVARRLHGQISWIRHWRRAMPAPRARAPPARTDVHASRRAFVDARLGNYSHKQSLMDSRRRSAPRMAINKTRDARQPPEHRPAEWVGKCCVN
jgi:hypothetical protein